MENSEWILIFNGLVALATMVLAVFTIMLWRSTDKLWKSGKEQNKVAKKATDAAKKAADAAKQANQMNKDNFIATQRPWVMVKIDIGGNLYYNVNGANITLRFYLKNIGHSPATHVNVRSQIIASAIGSDKPIDYRLLEEELRNQIRMQKMSPHGDIIFPGDTMILDITMSIGKDELERITQKVPFIHPTVIGCVDYGFVFEDGHHLTSFAVDIRRSERPREESKAKNRSPSAIFVDEGDIPISDLRAQKSFICGNYAD